MISVILSLCKGLLEIKKVNKRVSTTIVMCYSHHRSTRPLAICIITFELFLLQWISSPHCLQVLFFFSFRILNFAVLFLKDLFFILWFMFEPASHLEMIVCLIFFVVVHSSFPPCLQQHHSFCSTTTERYKTHQ